MREATDGSGAGAPPRGWRRLGAEPVRTRVIVAALALLALASPQHYRNDLHTANESARIYAALALVDHGTPRLDPVFDRYFPGWQTRGRPPNMDVAVRDGHYLLDKAPGLTLLAVPVVAALRLVGLDPDYRTLAWLLTLLLVVVPTVLVLLWLWPWVARGCGERAALVVPALVLTSPWAVYAGLLFGHALAAALVALGVALALGPLSAEAEGWAGQRAPLLGGLALGVAVLVEYPAAVLVVAGLAALGADPTRRRRLPWVVLGGVGPALVLLTWNHLVFGGPLAFSYGFKAQAQLAATHAQGVYGIGWPGAEALWGILGSARRGLLVAAPWLAVGIPACAAVALDRRLAPAWRALLAGGTLVTIAFIAGFGDWHGGRCVGPRYLVFLLPLPAVALGWSWFRLRERPARAWVGAALVGLGASSLLLAMAAATGFPYVDHAIANPWFEVVLPVLQQGGPGPTIWDGALARPAGAALALAATLAAGGLLLWRGGRQRPRSSPPGDPTPGLTPTRWVLGVVALSAALIHLALASLPQTTGPRARQRILRERAFAHELLDQPAAARRARRAARPRR